MTTKMKGLLKGLRYISQIFEEDKQPEMQIGFPTDVKHVAHIGWDGPSVDSPSWMKEFKSPKEFQSAPLVSPDTREDSDIKWVSEDSRRGNRGSHSSELPEMPRSSRRHSSTEGTDSPRKKDSKSRQARRHQSKDSSSDNSLRSNRQLQDLSISTGPGSPVRSGLPDIPKKSRRKKSKESVNGGGSSRSRSNKGSSSTATSNGTYTSAYSDPGPDHGSISRAPSSQLSPISSLDDEEDERRVPNSKEF